MTLETFLKIYFVQTALSGLVTLLSFYKFQMRPKQIKLIGLLFLCSCLSNLCQYYFPFYGNLAGSFYDFILIITMGLLYNIVMKGKYQKWITMLTLIFILFGVYNLIFVQKDSISSYNKLMASFIIIIYAVAYFYRLMIELPAVHLQRLPMFWFNSAFLIFNAGALFLFALTSYLVNVLKNDLLSYWSFHNSLSIIERFIVLIGLYYDLKNLKSTPSGLAKSASLPL